MTRSPLLRLPDSYFLVVILLLPPTHPEHKWQHLRDLGIDTRNYCSSRDVPCREAVTPNDMLRAAKMDCSCSIL